jgi:hypothetical protein
MPLTSRQWKESEDILEGWTIPTRRTEEEKKIYGPRAENLPKQLELLKELEEKLKKHPEIAMQLKADLAEQVAAHPDKSRFQIRLELLRHYLTNNKKLRMKGKFQRAHFIGIYEIFKGRKMVDNIFGDDLLQKTLEREEKNTGYLKHEDHEEKVVKKSAEREKMLKTLEKLRNENRELFAKKKWKWDDLNDVTLKHFLDSVIIVVQREKAKKEPKKKTPSPKPKPKPKSNAKSKPKTQTKRKRCPNGTRRNKKTGNCEPKK